MKLARTASALLLALLVVSSARVALADPPPAEFTIVFDGDAGIRNPLDGFSACDTDSDATMCLSLNDVSCDGAGRCEGAADVDFSGSVDGSGSGPFVGRIRCIATPDPNDPICRAVFRFEVIEGSVGPCQFDLRLRVNGPVDPDGLYHGKAAGSVCLSCPETPRQCAPVAGAVFEYAVNPPTPWSLGVHAQPTSEDPLRLEGEASDSLGFTYTVIGQQSVANGVSTLILRGDEETPSQGARVELRNLVFHDDDLQAGTAYIRVQGNKVRDKLGN